MNVVAFIGTVTKVYKSGIVITIPAMSEKGRSVNVWVQTFKDAAVPEEGVLVAVQGNLSSSAGKNSQPQLCVFASKIIPLGTGVINELPQEDIPF